MLSHYVHFYKDNMCFFHVICYNKHSNNMFTFLLLCVLVLSMQSVILPDAETINKRFHDEGLDYFAEKSNIAEKLGGKEKHPRDIKRDVQLAIGQVCRTLDAVSCAMMKMTEKDTIESVLLGDSESMEMMTVPLPDAETISKRLRANGHAYFDEKSNIAQELGGEEKYPLGVVLAVDMALYDMRSTLDRTTWVGMMMLKTMIIETILIDYPEAMEELMAMEELEL